MSNVINTYYQQAQMTLAAYANLTPGQPADIAFFRDKGMGAAQAQTQTFAATYEVLDRKFDATSYSATVFKHRISGEVTLAIRGTDDGLNLVTALVRIGLIGSAAFQPQYSSLYSQILELGGARVRSVPDKIASASLLKKAA